ncbi:MAG: hypothetical protein MUC67_07895 [Acidobacteria bacterium]|jgi:hypothetical protein|nr:hypothetical protein [Acidobacteriota bacterium]
MNRMIRPVPPARALVLAAALAALPAVPALSAPNPAPRPSASPQSDATKAPVLAAPDLSARPDLIEAAKIKPVPPETLERALPATVAGLARTESNKTVQPVGPVLLSVVTARYGAAGAERTVEVTVLDPAGLPAIGEIIPIPAEGEALDYAGRVLRRTQVHGVPAAVADGADGLPSLLQIIPDGRIRITMQAYGVSAKDLVAAATAIDFSKLK